MVVASKLRNIVAPKVMQLMLDEDTMVARTGIQVPRIPVIFFVWESEVEHHRYIKCECGTLCKKVNVSKKGLLPVFKFICINRYNKVHPGCKVYLDE